MKRSLRTLRESLNYLSQKAWAGTGSRILIFGGVAGGSAEGLVRTRAMGP